jgi:hypothetical protein
MSVSKDAVQQQWQNYVAGLLDRSNQAVEHGILAPYNLQTQDEQQAQTTKHSNGIGFSGADAPLGSYYANWLRSGKKLTGTHLTKARQMTRKYVRQLAELARLNASDKIRLQVEASLIREEEPNLLPGPKTFTMNRRGEFRIETFGDSHCGTLKDLGVQYEAKIQCTTKLDGRGFLFDQINIDNFFQTIKRTSLSCERLCEDCANKLAALIQKDNPQCEVLSLELTLSPQPYAASMTLAWSKKDSQ